MASSSNTATYYRWSVGAIECYERNCICKGCPTFDLIGKQCRMKQSVLRLVKNVGTPDTDPKQSIIDDENIKRRSGILSDKKEKEVTMHDNDLNLDYPNYCAKLIDAVKKGYESYDDLEKASGTSKHNLSVYFDNLYKAFLKNGLIQQSGKSHKQAVIDFIQSRLCDADYRQNEQQTQIDEQDTPPDEQNIQIVSKIEHEEMHTKSQFISRIADLSVQCTALMSENDKLRERIKELENQPKQTVDFTEAKQKLHTQIEQLQTQLNAIEIAERMMNKSEVK